MYLVWPGLIGGSHRGVRNLDQHSHLHYWTLVQKMTRVPASPTGRPRPSRCPSGRRMAKGLVERGERWKWSGGGGGGALRYAPSCPRSVPLKDTVWLWGLRGHSTMQPGNRNKARESRKGRRGVREREFNKGLANHGVCHQKVFSQLDGLRQRRGAMALDPLGRPPW